MSYFAKLTASITFLFMYEYHCLNVNIDQMNIFDKLLLLFAFVFQLNWTCLLLG